MNCGKIDHQAPDAEFSAKPRWAMAMGLLCAWALLTPSLAEAQTPGHPGTIFGDPPRSAEERREPQRPFEPLREDPPFHTPEVQPSQIEPLPPPPSPEAVPPPEQDFAPPGLEPFDDEAEPIIEGGTPETVIPGIPPGARRPQNGVPADDFMEQPAPGEGDPDGDVPMQNGQDMQAPAPETIPETLVPETQVPGEPPAQLPGPPVRRESIPGAPPAQPIPPGQGEGGLDGEAAPDSRFETL
jgi:hypothetical protein